MQGEPNDFWGKLDRNDAGRVVAWHPLEAHCADVAACCEALLRDTILGTRLARLLGRDTLTPVLLDRLVVLAALHDLGKYSIGFQNRPYPDRLLQGGHVAPIVKALSSSGRACDRVLEVLSPIGPFGDSCANYLAAAISHHGRPEKIGHHGDSTAFDPNVFAPAYGLNPFAGMAGLVSLAQTWCPDAFASTDAANELPDNPAAQHFFAGLVMLADWLGSDRRVFEYAEDRGDPMPLARERASKVLRARFLATEPFRPACRAEYNVFSGPGITFVPRPAQAVVSSLPQPSPGEATLTVLEAETGSGKTEAAIHRFAQLFHAGVVDGLYFALPTRTSATQIHERVVRAVANTFGGLQRDRQPPVTLAVPGYLRVDEATGQALPNFEVLWPDPGTTRDRTWAAEHPKRFLAGSIVVGTIDQALLSTLVVDHSHLRATALSRLLLVVDEVHASDAYMTKLLDELLAFHFACGGHALLMSATLGTTTRQQFMARVRSRDPLASLPKQVPMPLDEACCEAYPAVHHAGSSSASVTHPALTPGNPKSCSVELWPAIDDARAIAGRALEAARQGALVLVLRNTVADAVATQEALDDLAGAADRELFFAVNGVPTLHHARFADDDRRLLDDAVEARIGKHANRDRGAIVVATQTVQQSLDLDADLLITDLCPMDVLLQRIGRLHRHVRSVSERPHGFREAVCVVLDPGPLNDLIDERGNVHGRHGFGRVYEDVRIVEATRDLLIERPTLAIPLDSRMLVERTTHPHALDALVAKAGPNMAAHAMKTTGTVTVHRQLAKGHGVDRTKVIGEYGFPDRDSARRITTRLGEEDRVLDFETPFKSPFGSSVQRVKIPHWLAREWPSEIRGQVTSHLSVKVRFCCLGADGRVLASFVYDRLGLRAGPSDTSSPPAPQTEENADE
jgi:CRISPR-associated endonuclease/helicase Cas3